jgi:aerobic C4-dicarboxylate transport protein
MNTSQEPPPETAPETSPPQGTAKKRDRTHWLYFAVIVAVVAGVAVGILAPDVGKSVGVLGTMFVNLIKMMIGPVIFCTIVLGIGSVRKAATVGKVGGLAFVYFLGMSTFALAIGLVVGNLLHPGVGLNITESAGKGAELADKAHEAGGLMDFVQGIIPTTLFSALT